MLIEGEIRGERREGSSKLEEGHGGGLRGGKVEGGEKLDFLLMFWSTSSG